MRVLLLVDDVNSRGSWQSIFVKVQKQLELSCEPPSITMNHDDFVEMIGVYKILSVTVPTDRERDAADLVWPPVTHFSGSSKSAKESKARVWRDLQEVVLPVMTAPSSQFENQRAKMEKEAAPCNVDLSSLTDSRMLSLIQAIADSTSSYEFEAGGRTYTVTPDGRDGTLTHKEIASAMAARLLFNAANVRLL